MPIADIRRPGIINGLNPAALTRWTKHTSDNIDAINRKIEYVELDITHDTELLFDNPRPESNPIGFIPIATLLSDGTAARGLESFALDLTRTDGQIGFTPLFHPPTSGVGAAGEVIGPISRLRSAATALTSGVVLNVCATPKITLTAGKWRVRAEVGFIPANTTTVTFLAGGASLTSATLPNGDSRANPTNECYSQLGIVYTSSGNITIVGPETYIAEVADGATLDLYLVGRADFGASTCSVFGSLQAFRDEAYQVDYAATLRGYLVYE